MDLTTNTGQKMELQGTLPVAYLDQQKHNLMWNYKQNCKQDYKQNYKANYIENTKSQLTYSTNYPESLTTEHEMAPKSTTPDQMD
jgi:hypothetical protein